MKLKGGMNNSNYKSIHYYDNLDFNDDKMKTKYLFVSLGIVIYDI